ncbi:hypothetical protein EJB05_03264, partial [Eragrostis curvula]
MPDHVFRSQRTRPHASVLFLLRITGMEERPSDHCKASSASKSNAGTLASPIPARFLHLQERKMLARVDPPCHCLPPMDDHCHMICEITFRYQEFVLCLPQFISTYNYCKLIFCGSKQERHGKKTDRLPKSQGTADTRSAPSPFGFWLLLLTQYDFQERSVAGSSQPYLLQSIVVAAPLISCLHILINHYLIDDVHGVMPCLVPHLQNSKHLLGGLCGGAYFLIPLNHRTCTQPVLPIHVKSVKPCEDIAPMQLNACVSQRPVRRRVIPSRSSTLDSNEPCTYVAPTSNIAPAQLSAPMCQRSIRRRVVRSRSSTLDSNEPFTYVAATSSAINNEASTSSSHPMATALQKHKRKLIYKSFMACDGDEQMLLTKSLIRPADPIWNQGRGIIYSMTYLWNVHGEIIYSMTYLWNQHGETIYSMAIYGMDMVKSYT